jgi:hypothetical protein
MHLAILEKSIVDLPVFPVEKTLAVLPTVGPLAVVVALITIGLLSLAVGTVPLPPPLVGSLVESGDEAPSAVELVVNEGAPVVGSVGEDHQSVGTLRSPIDELPQEINPRFSDHLTLAVLLAVLPAALVEN